MQKNFGACMGCVCGRCVGVCGGVWDVCGVCVEGEVHICIGKSSIHRGGIYHE